ncbi:MAG: clostripain-related cysteine peptidase [Bariatricus sp.]
MEIVWRALCEFLAFTVSMLLSFADPSAVTERSFVLDSVPVSVTASAQDSVSASAAAFTSDGGRENAEQISTEKKAEMTIMFYCIGSDLESYGGSASADIEEILAAQLGQEIRLVMQTGGTSIWHRSDIKGGTVQRFVFEENNIRLVQDVGRISMVKADTLSDFIRWGKEICPADRYGIILWDHGGGTLGGFGIDEMFPSDGSMMISDLQKAFRDGGTEFEFIGFDACLMGTLELAYALSPYGQYLIASEETSRSTGWEYTGWLNALAARPSMEGAELGENIVDTYMEQGRLVNASAQGYSRYEMEKKTLSVIDLKRIPALYDALCSYFGKIRNAWDREYLYLADIRSKAFEYGGESCDQIDLWSFLEAVESYTGIDVDEELKEAFDNAVADKRATMQSKGIAFYYPYRRFDVYSSMLNELNSIGMNNADYQGFFSDFVSSTLIMQQRYPGQFSAWDNLADYTSGTISSGFGSSAAQESQSYSGETWYDQEAGGQIADELPQLNPDTFLAAQENGEFLELSEQDWSIIARIELNVIIYDEEGFIDLGMDPRYNLEGKRLSLTYDGRWVSVNGTTVAFNNIDSGTFSDGTWYNMGYIPARLNGTENINLVAYWDGKDAPNGIILGYQPAEEGDFWSVFSKYDIFEFAQNDKIEFAYDYYSLTENRETTICLPEYINVSDGLTVSYGGIEDNAIYAYCLTDIYQNQYWTEYKEY